MVDILDWTLLACYALPQQQMSRSVNRSPQGVPSPATSSLLLLAQNDVNTQSGVLSAGSKIFVSVRLPVINDQRWHMSTILDLGNIPTFFKQPHSLLRRDSCIVST